MTFSLFTIKALNKLDLLKWINFYTSTKVNNRKVRIPIHKKLGFQNLSLSEPWMTQVLKKLKPLYNGYFVDVGVNIGQTLIKAYSVFDDMHYTGFEPNSACVYYVEELIRINKIKNCHVIPVGVDRQSRISKLNFFDNNDIDSCASIIEQFRPDNPIDHYKYVPVFDYTALRDFLPAANSSILKIDVEGAELEVIKGFLPWLVETKPILLIEILPVYKKENEFRLSRQLELEKILDSLNYKIARIMKGDKVQLMHLDTIGIHAKIEDCDYILYHESLEKPLYECFNTNPSYSS